MLEEKMGGLSELNIDSEKKVILGETKKELDDVKKDIKDDDKINFEYMKKSMAEFDKIKKKINEINIPVNIRVKIVTSLEKVVYSRDNTEDKYKALKSMNEILQKIQDTKNYNINDIKKYIELYKQKLPKTLREDVQEKSIIFFIDSLILTLIFAAIGGTGILATSIAAGSSIVLIASIGAFLGSEFLKGEYDGVDKNSFFDFINDIYPQISKNEFDKIYELFKDGKFDILAFSKLMDKIEKDGKITYSEKKQIYNFLGIDLAK